MKPPHRVSVRVFGYITLPNIRHDTLFRELLVAEMSAVNPPFIYERRRLNQKNPLNFFWIEFHKIFFICSLTSSLLKIFQIAKNSKSHQ